jgi:hypothetical protein
MRPLWRENGSVIYCTIASGPCQSNHTWAEIPQNSRSYLTVSSETPPTWRARFPYLCPPGTGWPSYTPGHCVPFLSPLTTRRDYGGSILTRLHTGGRYSCVQRCFYLHDATRLGLLKSSLYLFVCWGDMTTYRPYLSVSVYNGAFFFLLHFLFRITVMFPSIVGSPMHYWYRKLGGPLFYENNILSHDAGIIVFLDHRCLSVSLLLTELQPLTCHRQTKDPYVLRRRTRVHVPTSREYTL